MHKGTVSLAGIARKGSWAIAEIVNFQIVLINKAYVWELEIAFVCMCWPLAQLQVLQNSAGKMFLV